MTTLLLDADIIAYKIASTAQETFHFPNCEPSIAVDEWGDVVPRIDAEVSRLCAKLETDKVIVCLSCPTAEGWRKQVLPTYKANRLGAVKPVYLQQVKDYLEAEYPSYRRPTLEADDIMGILSTHPTLVQGKKIIVSEDKDMKTIPGWLFNPAKDRQPRIVDEDEAHYWHMYQTLTGDATDGYSGCPGIGPVKASVILTVEPEQRWEATLATFIKRGLTEEDALVQAQVARICRASDYDFKKKEVILWKPSEGLLDGSCEMRSSSLPTSN